MAFGISSKKKKKKHITFTIRDIHFGLKTEHLEVLIHIMPEIWALFWQAELEEFTKPSLIYYTVKDSYQEQLMPRTSTHLLD